MYRNLKLYGLTLLSDSATLVLSQTAVIGNLHLGGSGGGKKQTGEEKKIIEFKCTILDQRRSYATNPQALQGGGESSGVSRRRGGKKGKGGAKEQQQKKRKFHLSTF